MLNLVCVIFVKQFGLPEAWLLLASVVLFVGATVVSRGKRVQLKRPRASGRLQWRAQTQRQSILPGNATALAKSRPAKLNLYV